MTQIDGGKIDALFADAVDRGAYAGGAAIAADRDGVLYEGGFGSAGADTLFRIASMTKAMTTAAVLHLADAGKLSLDDEVRAHIPAYGELQVLDGFDGDTPILRAPASQSTVRQLLNHTSGHGYAFLNEKLVKYHEVTGTPSVLAFHKSMLTLPLVNDPGTAWEYGISTDWAGQVVEAVSGQTLGEYLAANVWGPLGMTDTTFDPTGQESRMIAMQSRMPDGTLQPNGIELPAPPEMHSGGGGSYSTVGDYARFMRMLLNGGELDGTRILSTESVELMFTPSLGGLQLPEVIVSADKALCNDIPSAPVPQDWGLGLHLMLGDLPGMRVAGTGDWAGLTNCYYWIDRTSGVCGAVLTQALPFFDEQIVMGALQFEGTVYAEIGATTAA